MRTLGVLLASAAIMIHLLVSCNTEEVLQTKFELAKSSVEVIASGGDASVGYTLENPKENVQFEFDCEADWLGSFAAAADSEITFTASANEVEEPRETEVTVIYGDIARSFTVKQAAFVPDAPVLTVNDEKVTVSADGGSAQVTYVIENPDEELTLEAESAESWVSDFDFSTDGVLEFVVEKSKVEEIRTSKITLTYGEATAEFVVEQEAAVLPEFGIVEDTVKVDYNGGAAQFTYNLENPEDGVSLEVSCEAGWISSIDKSVDGVVSFDVALNEGEEREAVVTVTYGDLEDEVVVKQSGKVDPFEVTIDEVSTIYLVFDIIPQDKDLTYNYMVMTKAKYDSFGSDQAVCDDLLAFYDMMASMYEVSREEMLATVLVTGDLVDMKQSELDINTEYCVFVYGMNTSGEVTTEAVKEFTTTENCDDIDFSIDFDIAVKGQKMDASIIPSDKSQRFYFEFMTPAEIDKYGVNCEQWVQDIMEANIAFGEKFGIPLEEVLKTILVSGDRTVSRDLSPNTAYRAAGAAVNDGGFVCSLASYEDFTMGDPIVVTARVNFTYDEYYDAEEVSANYPDYAEYAGSYVLPVEIVPEEGLQDFYFIVYSGNSMDTVYYPDSFMVSYIMKDGFKNQQYTEMILDYDTDYTYFTVGCDENGITGPVSRGLINLSKGGVSPADGFTPQSNPQSSAAVGSAASSKLGKHLLDSEYAFSMVKEYSRACR